MEPLTKFNGPGQIYTTIEPVQANISSNNRSWIQELLFRQKPVNSHSHWQRTLTMENAPLRAPNVATTCEFWELRKDDILMNKMKHRWSISSSLGSGIGSQFKRPRIRPLRWNMKHKWAVQEISNSLIRSPASRSMLNCTWVSFALLLLC